MIISRTPYRISLFGGGTDYPAWYRENGGQVLSATIDKYVYITCRNLPPFFKHSVRLAYSKVEECAQVKDIEHPAAREVLSFFGIQNNIEIHYDGDLPGRSGMGSSSAFTVGLVNALHAFKGQIVSPHQLGMESVHIEQDVIKEHVGSQDQISAAHGGFNKICFKKSGEIIVNPMTLKQERLNELCNNFMLFFTGITRNAPDIAKTYVLEIEKRASQLRRMHDMVDEAINLISGNGDLDDVGRLLGDSWQEKRSMSQNITNDRIDNIYSRALSAGALGGKVSGAGGGGMMVFFVPESKRMTVRKALQDLLYIPFQFETAGSQIIFYEPSRNSN